MHCACRFCVSRKGGTGGGGWGNLHGGVHMAAAGLAVKRPWLTVGKPFLILAVGMCLEKAILTL